MEMIALELAIPLDDFNPTREGPVQPEMLSETCEFPDLECLLALSKGDPFLVFSSGVIGPDGWYLN